MKNLRLIIVLFVLLSVTFSCSKDSDVATNSLIGTWEEKSSNTILEPCGFTFNSDGTGNFFYYSKGIKSDPVNLTYEFYEKTMELKIFWINMSWWDNPTYMIEIQNGNILVCDNVRYYKK